MSIKVCHITLQQAQAFEQRGETPDCKNGSHRHITATVALRLAGLNDGSGPLRWVGERYRMVCDVPMRVWKPKRSDGYSLMQMVRGGTHGTPDKELREICEAGNFEPAVSVL